MIERNNHITICNTINILWDLIDSASVADKIMMQECQTTAGKDPIVWITGVLYATATIRMTAIKHN